MMNEQELRDIYNDPSKGYQSAEKLYQKAKADGVKVSRRLVKEWLETQDTYTRFKPAIWKHKFMKTFVKGLADQIQMDLVDMGKYASKNKGYRWVLTSVEILSRYAFTVPVYRKDTKNMTKAVDQLLGTFRTRFGNTLTLLSLRKENNFIMLVLGNYWKAITFLTFPHNPIRKLLSSKGLTGH